MFFKANLLKRLYDQMTQKKIFEKLSDYITEKRIFFLKASSRNQALLQLTGLLTKEGTLEEQEPFYQALLDREKIVSTGIGMGVAIPHAKIKTFKDFFVVLAIQKNQRGLDWQSIDKFPVKIIFMVGGPDDQPEEYLRLLSSITTLIKEETFRGKLLNASSPKEVWELIKDF